MRSEKNENSPLKSETTVLGNLKNLENTNESGLQGLGSSYREEGPSNALFVCSLTQGFPTPMLINKLSLVPGQSDQIPVERFSITSEAWDTTLAKEDDTMALKLSSSSFKASDTESPLCNEDHSHNPSVKALQRSKKRVRAVISTELPFLIEKEFPIDKENDHCVRKRYADVHRTRWSSLFDQMDKSLFGEEKQLESWSNQVKQMQLCCEQGLQLSHRSIAETQQLGALDAKSRSWEEDKAEKELAVSAAAASIFNMQLSF